MTRYVTASRVAKLERTLSERDNAIIETLDQLRAATTGQLKRLHFADLTEASAARQTPRALRRLAAHRVVMRLERQLGGVRAGSNAAVWALDAAGQRLASASGPAGGQAIRRPWTPSVAFLAHRLAISEVYVELLEAARSGLCKLETFEAEPLAWRRYADPHGGWSYLKPDAFAALVVGDFERGSFIEIDRATESIPTITRKLTSYRRYWESGREQERRGYFPQVVVGVPNESRKNAIVDACGRQPEEAWQLFRVVLVDDLVDALVGRAP